MLQIESKEADRRGRNVTEEANVTLCKCKLKS